MTNETFFEKYFKSSEETISMLLGLVIVLVVVGMVFNYFQRRRGTVEIPGVTQKNAQMQVEDKEITSGNEYVVKANDSLWKIAVTQYGDGYAWTKIAKENGLRNPGVLHVGQKLKLVAISKESLSNTEGVATEGSYIVARGDSLWKIAVAQYGDGYVWTKIWNLNRLKIRDPGKLEIGMSLRMPARS